MADNQLMRAGGADASIYSGYGEMPNALQMMGVMQAQENARTANELQKLELANKQLGALRSSFSSLASKGDLSHGDIISEASRLVAAGIVPREMAAREIQASQAFANDPAKLKQFVTGHLTNIVGAQEQLNLAYPNAVPMNTGDRTIYTQPNRLTGSVGVARGSAAVIPNEAGPESRMVQDTTVDPSTGANVAIPRGSRFDTRGNVKPVTVAPQAGGGTAPAGALQTSQTANFQAGQKAYSEDLSGAATRVSGTQPLLKAIPLLESLGAAGAGPGSEAWNRAKNFLVTQGVLNENASNADVRDEVKKYLNQYVGKSGVAQRSDMGQALAEQSSPNLGTAQKATLELARNAIAYDRMEAARPLSYKDKPDGYLKYKAEWTQTQDPRAYRIDLMPITDRAELMKSELAKLKGGKPEEKKSAERFFRSLRNAHSTIYAPDGGANAP